MKLTMRTLMPVLAAAVTLAICGEALAIPTGTMGIRTYDVEGIQIAADLRVERVDGPYLIDPMDITTEEVGPYWLNVPAQTYAIFALGNTGEPYPGPPLAVITVPGGAHDILVNLFVPTPCPTDVDDDRTTGFADLLAVLADWGPCLLCPSDINEDHLVDFDDLLAVLSAWGDCPD